MGCDNIWFVKGDDGTCISDQIWECARARTWHHAAQVQAEVAGAAQQRRLQLISVVFALLLTTVSCGELQPPEPSRAPTVTVTRDACTADGLGALIPERFRMTFVNGTSDYAVFYLVRINDGSSYQELAAYVGEEQRPLRAGESLPGTPPFVTMFIQRAFGPLGRSDVETTLPRGSYGIVCAQGNSSRTEALFVLGPYVVP